MKRTFAAHALAAGLSLFALSAASADNWPQWRGPTGDGISKETNIPTKWSATENVAWKLPLPGVSGGTPVVWGDRIFLTSEESDGVAECEHSYASPVLWRNGKEAYLVTHGNDYAIAHSLKDGSEIWRVGGLNPKGAKYNRTLRFVASPVATPDLIVVPSAKRGPVVGV